MAKKRGAVSVLVVEDDAEVRNFAARVLELEGYRVLQAEDGDEGLRLAREGETALVLLDLMLPGRDGWAVLKELKSEQGLSAVPVVVFSSEAGMAQRMRAFSMGAADYLVKPFSAASLRKTIARILLGRG